MFQTPYTFYLHLLLLSDAMYRNKQPPPPINNNNNYFLYIILYPCISRIQKMLIDFSKVTCMVGILFQIPRLYLCVFIFSDFF